ncbi:TonB-dependent receptor plug domain-containing protein [Pseudoxanthomonas daejeonensis]|uniref:TonB-dependent receptor plug domain-containing protein n=1 Tax=Pseudoxanthomonas daejeonensis TaxID=266062 RepID=UPI0013917F3F|nr:TonB-dependent receptor [Pseudoxanthomonas daejeonensis]
MIRQAFAARTRSAQLRPRAPIALACTLALSIGSAVAAPARDGEDAAATTELPRLQVTGSHLRRVELETAQPLLVLQRDELLRTGLSNLGEILQQLPQHVSDLNSDYNNGGNGETRVDLRNLESKRTLVLLNGRRYVNTLDGAVDVGSIPLAIVERVEVLTAGASAIYGSDAIAGVVNVITRDDFEGVDAGVLYASNEQGDGQRRSADLSWGRLGERGSVALNLSFSDQQPILARDRAISAVPMYGFPANDTSAGASANTPQGRIGFGRNGNRMPDGSPGQLTWDPALAGHRRFDGSRDGYNYAEQTYLRTPYTHTALFAQGRYDLAADLSVHANVLLHRRRSSQQLAPAGLTLAGNDPYAGPDIDAANVYNPFGQAVTFLAFRPLNRDRRFEQEAATHYVSLALAGIWRPGGRVLDWELGVIDARTRVDEDISGGFDLGSVARGVGPSFLDSRGVATCGSAAAPVAGCVPLDFLHGSDGFTDAMYASISADGWIQQERDLRDIAFRIGGALLEWPAGQVAAVAGLEHRRERGRLTPDPLLADHAFDFGNTPYDPIAGETRVDEAFLEFELPLLAGRPWADALSLNLATRHSRYSNFGSTTNSQAGLAWQPVPALLLRANWSQGFRAPSTTELYASSFSTSETTDFLPFDPCANQPSGEVAARCAAAGVPLDDFDPQVGPEVRLGANPDLQPEHSRNRGAGVVWSPARIAGLELSVDWWRIDLEETIYAIPASVLPSICYEEGLDSACAFLRRDAATGELLEIDARLQNFGRYQVEGWDLGLGYRWSSDWGDFGLRWDSVYLVRSDLEVPKGAPPSPLAGNYYFLDPGWRLRSLLSLDWERSRWGGTVRLRYYPALDESCDGPQRAGDPSVCDRPDVESPLFGAPVHIIDARLYTDLQLRWQPRAGMVFSLGVSNAFGHDPPVAYSSINSYDPSYDVPGRFWHAGYRQRF